MEEEGERKKENEKRRSLLPRGEYSNAISMRNIKIPHKSIGTAGSLAYVHRLGVRSITNRIAIERFLRSIHNSFHCSSPRGRSLRQSWVLSTRRRRRRRTRSLDESIIHVWTLSFIGLPGNTERSIDDDSRGPISIAISFPTPLCTCVHVSFSSVCVCVLCVYVGEELVFSPLRTILCVRYVHLSADFVSSWCTDRYTGWVLVLTLRTNGISINLLRWNDGVEIFLFQNCNISSLF